MKLEWFVEIANNWFDGLGWKQQQIERAAKLLYDISASNLGVTIHDVEHSEEIAFQHALQCVLDVLDIRCIRYAQSLVAQQRKPKFIAHLGTQEAGGSQVDLCRYMDKSNLNAMSLDELIALPAIGRVSAYRIVEYRRQLGALNNLDELSDGIRLSEQAIDVLREQTYCGLKTDFVFMTQELEEFVKSPSFPVYVKLVKASGGKFIRTPDSSMTIDEHLFNELELGLSKARSRPIQHRANLGGMRASKVIEKKSIIEQGFNIHRESISNIQGAELVFDEDYQHVIEDALAGAEKSISVIMFYFRVLDDDYPTSTIFTKLISKHQDGLQVRIILDKDREQDVYKSRLINLPAFRALEKAGVPVRFDSEDSVTHSKVVVVDTKTVILGSHNWTGGSLASYDDTSVRVHSDELADHYEKIFNKKWKECGAGPGVS